MGFYIVAVLAAIAVVAATVQIVRSDYGGAILSSLPLSFFRCRRDCFLCRCCCPRYTCIGICIVLGLLCFTSLFFILIDGPWAGPFSLYGLGIMLFTFFGNYLAKVTVKH